MSSYGRAAPPHHNYELFSIVRLVGISNQLGSDLDASKGDKRTHRTSMSRSTGIVEEQRVTILHVAAGGYVDHSFVAMALSNDTIIFRFVGDSGVPVVRQMAWTFKDQHDKRIVAMSFNPTAQWLMVLAADATVVLIPIYFLMCKKNLGDFEEKATPIVVNEKERFERLSSLISSPSSWFGKMTGQQDNNTASNGKRRLNDVTVITIGSSKQLDATHCVWWKTWNGGDYGIISTSHGSIIIINFFNEEIQYKHKIKFPVVHMDIVQDSAKSYKYLLLHTKNGGYWKILLEHELDYHMYETIIDAKTPNSPQFIPALLTRFAPETSLTVQHTAQGSIIAAYNRASAKLEIYDPEPGKFALFVYQLPAGTAMFHFTSKLTFVVGSTAADAQETSGAAPESDLSRIAVISNLIAGTTVNPRWFLRHQIQSIMQQFSLPPKEKVKGMLSYDSPHSAESAEGNFYVWTTNGLYEIRQKMSPEKIFFQLLAKGLEKTDAEPFGKTFRLDLFTLYEQAADREFEAGNYGRALDLYYLSNVRTSKLIGKYLDIGRMDIVMTHLKGTLHQPEALPVGDRKMLSDILFKCYLQKLLASKDDFSPLEHEFHTFLALNQDYDAGKALVMLLNSGLTDYFLEVANSRKLMPTALNILVNRGSMFLDINQINFLKAGYATELKTCGNGSIFQCLPTELQIKLILEDPSSIPRNARRINQLISSLDENTLLDIAHCFDPLGDNIHLILNADTTPVITNHTPPTSPLLGNMSSESSTDTPIRPEEYLELFIAALLSLNHKRAQRKTPAPAPSSLRMSRASSQSLRASRSASTSLAGAPRSPSVVPRSNSVVDLEALPPGFSERKAVKIACGWHHACFITESGELYTWGKNNAGQLGHGPNSKLQTSPKRVDALRGVVVVMASCGGEHTVIADQSHTVYSWGDGKFGQLGLGMKQMQPLPRKMEALQGVKIRQIACGHSHTVFLTKSGEVYSCGHGEQGQLGLGGLANKLAPTRVEAQEIAESGKGASIACGHCHTVLCTEAGDVYSWGAGGRGQLGHGTIQPHIAAPKLVSSLRGKHIRSVSCGPFHTIAISDLNNVYSWGQGKSMRLGHGGDRDEIVPRIVEILMNKNVRSAAGGQIHTVALCTEQNGDAGVYVWGGADNGRLGLGDDVQFVKPMPTLISALSGSRIASVACGEDFTLACTEAGALYAWGANTHGQLGQGDVNNCFVPTLIPTTSLSERSSRALGISTLDASAEGNVVYGQDTLETTLKTQIKHFRHGIVLSRCMEYGNFAAAATIYDELNDDTNALDCRLQAISARFHPKPYDPAHPIATTPSSPPLPTTPPSSSANSESDSDPTSSPDIIKPDAAAKNKLNRELNNKEEIRLVLYLVTVYICKPETPRNIKEREKGGLLGREYLLLQVLQYWKLRALPIEPLENFILENLANLSDPLCHILENPPSSSRALSFSPPTPRTRTNNHPTPPSLKLSVGPTNNPIPPPSPVSPFSSSAPPPTPPKPPESLENVLPWVLEFSSQLYTKVVHFSLQKMVQDTEKETPVSERHLWGGIKENMEKELSRREAIVIQHLSAPSTPKVHDGSDSKDVAFTCGHHMTRRALVGHVVPQLLQRLEMFPVAIPATTRLIVACYKLKMIPLACPMCLYNYMREAVPSGDSLRAWQ